MEKVAYYPGCALKDRSSHLDRSARDSALGLGFELEEIDPWTCCGAVPPVSRERVMNLVAPSRILRTVQESGRDVLITVCDFCYNTLKRTNFSIHDDPMIRRRVNAFLADDRSGSTGTDGGGTYDGNVRVLHLLEYIRDAVGFGNIPGRLTRPLRGLKLAAYYGCVMLRPLREIQLDNPEDPSIIDDLITAVGAEAVRYPYRTECCGSYLSVSNPDASARLCHSILSSARDHGAEALIVSCPLCFHNLDSRQKAIMEMQSGFKPLPVLYFTQLLSMALGNGPERQGFGKHAVDVTPLLERIGAGHDGEVPR
jgi:heterodisulfide reductase subunit B